MLSIHSIHRKEISPDFFLLLTDALSEDRNTTLSTEKDWTSQMLPL